MGIRQRSSAVRQKVTRPVRKSKTDWLHLKEVTINGWLTGLLGFFGGMDAVFGSDMAYKYVNPYVVYWLHAIGQIGLQITLPLKGFFSTAYRGRQKKG